MANSSGKHNAPLNQIQPILEAIINNPDCQQGVLNRQGYVYTEHGECSYKNRPELIVFITPRLFDTKNTCAWYGHVLNHKMLDGESSWISVLVRTYAHIDSANNQSVFQSFKNSIQDEQYWEAPLAQNHDDIFSSHKSFDEAAQALVKKIEIFRIACREPGFTRVPTPSGSNYIDVDYPNIPNAEEVDLCYINIYGLGEKLRKEGSQ